MYDTEDIVNYFYHTGEIMVYMKSDKEYSGGCILDRTGKIPQEINVRGPFGETDEDVAKVIFALCGIDPKEKIGRTQIVDVHEAYRKLGLIETVEQPVEWGADTAADAIYDMEESKDPVAIKAGLVE